MADIVTVGAVRKLAVTETICFVLVDCLSKYV